MNKKTIAIVSISVILAILAVAVIATFPTYIFEETKAPTSSSKVDSDNITESTPGEDVGNLGGDSANNENSGIESVLPDVDDETIGLPETPITNYETLSENKGAKLLGETNAFERGTEFSVDKLGVFDKKYYQARHKVRGFAKEYLMYNITAQKDGKDVIAKGIAKVVLDIPENYNLDQTEVYFISASNSLIQLNCTINKTNRTATVTFTQSGVYVLIEKKLTDSNNTSTQVQNSSSNLTSSDETESSKPSSSNDASSSNPVDSSDTSTTPDTSSTPSTSEPDTSSTPSTSEPDTSSTPDSSEPDTSEPDSSEEADPNKDSMNGWTPWR